MKTFRCVILEDQRPAQKVLERYIGDTDSLELVGVYSLPSEAFAGLEKTPADILFLDLNLPKLDGFSFLRTLVHPPAVIVTTADPEQAIEGYNHDVVDYLLKPFSFERFLHAIEKARLRTAESKSPSVETHSNAEAKELFLRRDGAFQRVIIDDILFVESDGDFISLHTESGRLYVAGTLQGMLDRLPPTRFIRIHKSFVVNISRITHASGSELSVEGVTMPVGRSYKENLLQRLTQR